MDPGAATAGGAAARCPPKELKTVAGMIALGTVFLVLLFVSIHAPAGRSSTDRLELICVVLGLGLILAGSLATYIVYRLRRHNQALPVTVQLQFSRVGETTDDWISISTLLAYMASRLASCLCLLVCLHHLVFSIAFDGKLEGDIHILRVGEELHQETLPFKKGRCIYLLHGLKSSLRYEVKISYPASIPASFSIHLQHGDNDLSLSLTRRLLNTEKLIFVADANYLPAGILALPNEPERESVLFNIVCDELLIGIPYKAWRVGILALFCLGLAAVVTFYFPPSFRPSPSIGSGKLAFSRTS